ncbi:MAG: hypothetical protein M1114_01665 [Candidatus Dependentiae bacterium]|nr:hypothetical protein [Candidatus Dependentiae bacterium]
MKSMYLMITLLVGVSSICAMDEIKKPTANRFGSRSTPLLKVAYPTQASSSDEPKSNEPLSPQRPGSPYHIYKVKYKVKGKVKEQVIDQAAILKAYSDKRYSSSQSLPTIPETE